MSEQTIAPLTLDGWFVLHQFFRLAPGVGPSEPDPDDLARRAEGLAGLFRAWDDLGEDGWSGLFRMVGGGNDYMAVHFRSTLDALGDAERALERGDAARDLVQTGDYLSVVELGLYNLTASLVEEASEEGIEHGSPEWSEMVADAKARELEKAYVRRRLQPRQPDDMPYVCFYPMDKRRAVEQNWYTLPVEERARMMHDHGGTGRRYAGRVSQVITGSVGLDDWEWAVTLFAGDPITFKDLVTEMRYDEVSAVYAEFGRFYVGRRVPADEIAADLTAG